MLAARSHATLILFLLPVLPCLAVRCVSSLIIFLHRAATDRLRRPVFSIVKISLWIIIATFCESRMDRFRLVVLFCVNMGCNKAKCSASDGGRFTAGLVFR